MTPSSPSTRAARPPAASAAASRPDPEALAAALLDAARRAGAEAADALVYRGTSVSVGVRAGRLEDADRAEALDLGLRVLMGRRQACVSASDASPDTLAEMAERAVAMAREAPEDPGVGLADPAQLARAWDAAALDLVDPAPEPDPAALQHAALAAEAAALSHPGIAQSESAGAGYSRSHYHLAATNGFSGGLTRTSHGLSCVVITGTGTGMERDYAGESRLHAADMPTPESIGHLAAERTLARAGARQPRTGTYPILFDERVAASLIGHLLQAINGTAIARGASWARDLLGQQVLPETLSLTEDPHRRRGPASRPYDGEGLPTAPRAIIDAGRLTGWTLDLATARKLGLQSTANAARGTASPPSPGITNVALTQGTATRADLMRDMGTGLLRHLHDRRHHQPQHRRLFPRRRRPLGRERRARPRRQRMHHRRQPHPHAPRADPRQRRAGPQVPHNPLASGRGHDPRRRLRWTRPILGPDHAADLALLRQAAAEAAEIALGFHRRDPQVWHKPDEAGPVSEADLAVDAHLRQRLLAARPGYGWLSEETPDGPARLAHRSVFVVDPIDGTRAFVAGTEVWGHSLAVVTGGVPTAAVVLMPLLGKCYTASLGGGAYLGDTPLKVSGRTEPDGATLYAAKSALDPKHWPGGPPSATATRTSPMAYRLARFAEGKADALLSFSGIWEWDLAGGALLATEAGAKLTAPDGTPIAFNAPSGRAPGALAANVGLWEGLRGRM